MTKLPPPADTPPPFTSREDSIRSWNERLYKQASHDEQRGESDGSLARAEDVFWLLATLAAAQGTARQLDEERADHERIKAELIRRCEGDVADLKAACAALREQAQALVTAMEGHNDSWHWQKEFASLRAGLQGTGPTETR